MQEDEFCTTDLWLAAFLEQMRRERIGYSKNDRGIVTFRYAGRETCEALREQYELDTVEISLPEFHAKVERLLVLIFGPKPKRRTTAVDDLVQTTPAITHLWAGDYDGDLKRAP